MSRVSYGATESLNAKETYRSEDDTSFRQEGRRGFGDHMGTKKNSVRSGSEEYKSSPKRTSHIQRTTVRNQSYISRMSSGFVPGPYEETKGEEDNFELERRSWKRRVFLILTEPHTSHTSLVFFTILVVTITASNILMILQTQREWQFTPTDCITCGGPTSYIFEDDEEVDISDIPENGNIPCVCPPAPLPILNQLTNYMIYFFTAEWIGRVLFFQLPLHEKAATVGGCFQQWFHFVTDTSQVLDFLAIFPYYLENISQTNGLVSLRLLRLFRVFQLIRLGQYNDTFISLNRVLAKSIPFFKLLLVVLSFGAVFFGSMIYWLEKGEWKYNAEINDWVFMRLAVDGVTEEITPFDSITSAFWWFIVTATTVGYGDEYPTSPGGKIVAVLAMLTGVLVIAFPVSVFSDLWSKELKEAGALDGIDSFDDSSNSSSSGGGDNQALLEGVELNRIQKSNAGDSRSAAADKITMTAQDFEAICVHMQNINESQQRIRYVLQKYGVDGI